ncbi:MAG TPA: xanthine dehydrogenase family protein molybdopterin-binding subunit [Acidimicrobiales bacterium]|nr:xanthine dehydrogenase family protein molybdopterin-binding subunit [Acidimicrobiales bacterium]
MAKAGSILGNAVTRLEDPALVTGAGKYVDDLDTTGAARIVFVRSGMAHGELRSVDVSEATGMPGVIAVYSAAGDDLGLEPFQGFPLLPPEFNRPVFARDRVRFVGDIVAAVVAETAGQAVDAAESIVVDIDPLPAVTSQAAALAPDAPILFPEAGSNVCFVTNFGSDEDPLVGADAVAEVTMVSQRLAGVPMEPNGCLAVPGEPEGGITCWISHQTPHAVHPAVAGVLGLDPEKVRIVCPWVGGGFGPKAAVYVEYLATAAAAMQLGRPVKWMETRSEDMLALVHGRDYTMTAKLGVRDDGRIVGLDAEIVASGGAYPVIGAVLPMLTQMMVVGVYDIPKVRFKGTTAVTNNTPVGAYRGAGRPEATQLIERVIDVAADKIGVDPAEIRRRNFLDPDAFPLTTTTGGEYDSGEYAKSLDAALAAAGYDELRAEQTRRRDAGDRMQLGIGVSTYVEVTAPLGLHTEYGAVEVHDDGTASMAVGTSVHGQGHHTAFAMIASDVLGIPMEKIRLVNSDTAAVPRGAGTLGSRSLQTAGNAVLAASNEVLARAKQIAAHLLEASPDDIVAGDDALHVAGVPGRTVPWTELAAASQDPSRLPDGVEAGPLRFEGDFDGSNSTFPFGTHVSVVEVDMDTGRATMLRHIAVDDCGRILNPLLVRGQQHGGIAQGAAQALYEWVQYDADGNPLTTNLADYAIPAATELISFETSNTETDSPRNPLGAKGIGESGTIGSTPAIQNAVVDALSHLGITHIDMPCTPERVWRAIRSAPVGASA